MKRILLLISFVILILSVNAQKKLFGPSFGLIPDSGTDATPHFQKMLEAVKGEKEVTIILTAGRYDFFEEGALHKKSFEYKDNNGDPKNLSILIEEFENLTIDCSFATFMFHGKLQPITIENSKNIKIQNLYIDFATPTSLEVQVINVTSDYFEIKFDKTKYPYLVHDQKVTFYVGKHESQPFGYIEFNPQKNFVEPNTGDRGWEQVKVVESAPGVLKIYNPQKNHFPQLNNWLVIRHGTSTHAGIFILNSSDITIQNMNIYQTDGVGILAQYSKDLNFFSCSVVPNFNNGVKFLSSHDGGFQITGCSGIIRIDNCDFYGLMDDAVHIEGSYIHVNKVSSKKIRAQVKKGMILENISFIPDIKIANSRFRSGRGNGVVISTPGNIWIENNVFEPSGSAILIAGDIRNRYESNAVNSVSIKKNIFRFACLSSIYPYTEAVISVYPQIAHLNPLKPYHTNIRIEDNSFFLFDYPILYAKSVDGLIFAKNRLYRSKDIQPFHYNKFGVKLVGCKNVIIGNNKEEGEILGKKVVIEDMDPKEVNKSID